MNTSSRTVLVSGASAGFGTEIARVFIARGDTVIALARRADRLQALRDQLGDRLVPLVLDVADRAAVARAIDELPPALRSIDVLINNAGTALGLEMAQKADLNDWDQMVDVNIKGLTYLTRAVLPGMVERNRGTVVNIGSIAGTYPYPGGNVYGATKAFVKQFSLNLRADLTGTAVRVTNFEPGMVAGTEFSTVRFRGDQARADANYAGVDALTATDIAETILWIVDRPAHVNINRIEVMPVAQSFARTTIHRRG